MRAVLALATLVYCCGQPSADQNEWLAKGFAIIKQHHLLSAHDLKCSTLIYGAESTPRMAAVTVLEKHGRGGCPGDVETSPRMFTLDIDTKTGRATWDHGDPWVMKPIP